MCPIILLPGATPASTVDTLYYPALLQLVLGHPADAVGGEVGVPGLDTPQAAEVLVTLLLPLGDQGRIGNLLLKEDTGVKRLWRQEILMTRDSDDKRFWCQEILLRDYV